MVEEVHQNALLTFTTSSPSSRGTTKMQSLLLQDTGVEPWKGRAGREQRRSVTQTLWCGEGAPHFPRSSKE